ncbi:hypothetical protein KILIM_004_01180 [Kineosphaera limosa NBRC 100340]|uniref:Uncharacterized protein n=1 Tax=Kineosphaera limosa NBRC 100340 TaxID=1184609 RepID=K6WKM9_9MICO|nr:hypothetical protein KILIM_004_01180 [Kineosphaera limosa NBRC 100340]
MTAWGATVIRSTVVLSSAAAAAGVIRAVPSMGRDRAQADRDATAAALRGRAGVRRDIWGLSVGGRRGVWTP